MATKPCAPARSARTGASVVSLPDSTSTCTIGNAAEMRRTNSVPG
ncbi:hypothetical protein N234_02600 [Ralstonia pickettii DTP0602]|nr:hypothetical protein N234_02600 [Ralstonia pickettii DTP0602]